MPDKLARAGFWLGNALLPVAVLLIAAAFCNLGPFGSNLFMLNDMNAQYVDFFAWYRDILLGQDDPFYTAHQALGQNAVGTIAYYLASPLNVLVLAFSERDIYLCFLALTLVKAALIQTTTTFYLRRRFSLPRTWACTLALGFTLSMWTLMQVRNIMWLDGLIFLPLCALGTYALMRDGKWRMLTLSLAGAIITCWYMGYMIVLFLMLYVLFEGYAVQFEGIPSYGRVHRKRLLMFAGCMALSLAVSAFIFLPMVFSMAGGGGTGGEGGIFANAQELMDEHLPVLAGVPVAVVFGGAGVLVLVVLAVALLGFRRYTPRRKMAVLLLAGLVLMSVAALALPALQQESIANVVQALFTGTWSGSLLWNDSVPQLFAGTVATAFAIVFFASKRIPAKLKLASALMLFVLVASTWLRPLMVIWGGMRLPHGYQSRMAFFAVFFIIWMAAYAVSALRQGSGLRLRDSMKRWLPWAMLALAVLDAIIRSCLVWDSLYQEGDQSYIDDYYDSSIVQAAELEERDPGVYRVAKPAPRYNSLGYNEGLTYGFYQLASYSSTNGEGAIQFLSDLGYGDGEFITYDSSTLLGDSLFGVKYASAWVAPTGFVDVGLMVTDYPEDYRFWENPYALSLGYAVDEGAVGFQLPEGNRYERLNALAQALAGTDAVVYPQASSADSELSSQLDMDAFVQVHDALEPEQFAFEEFGGSRISGTFTAGESQVLLMTIPNQAGWRVWVDGAEVTPQDVCSGALMAIPTGAGSHQVEMRFTPPGLLPGCIISLLALLIILAAPKVLHGRKRPLLS
ncbi:MAG: YfhO family protein [Eggerthellaceae bacterium]|nr:YfhO family protein [Eggerthellaceae bacterium]